MSILDVYKRQIYYSYDTDTRILTIKTNIVEVFDDILNGKNSSLKTKIRERIKDDFPVSYTHLQLLPLVHT